MQKLLKRFGFANYYTIFFCLGLFMTPSVLEAQLSGKVFRDLNTNGVYDVGENPEANIRVVAFNANGDSVTQVLTTATLDVSGNNYTFTGLTLPIRLEFRLPSYLYSANGAVGQSSVQVFTSANSAANLAVHYPASYCQTNPNVIIPSFVAGNPQGGGTGGTIDALISFPLSRTGTTPTPTPVAIASEVGSIWGSAYQKESKKMILSAMLKRHSGLHSLGLGGLFIGDFSSGSGSVSPYINIENFGINFGSSLIASRTLPASATATSSDSLAFVYMGKVGIGSIDLSDNGQVLWGVNLYAKTIFSFNIGNPMKAAASVTNADFTSHNIPNPGCTNGLSRPWAIEFYEGKVYVGVICSGETSGNQSNLFAYVYRFDPATNTWDAAPVVSFALNYPKGKVHTSYAPDKWETWANTFNDLTDQGTEGSPVATRKIRPQPILTDIQFDKRGNMILGFTDRTGHQTGRNQIATTGGATLYNGYVGGDILYLKSNGSGGFTLESNGSFTSGPTGSGVGNSQGPGGGEFFGGEFYLTTHQETMKGGMFYHPQRDEIVVNQMDPLGVFSGGIGRHSVSNGYTHDTMRYEIFNTSTPNGTFGNANGLGLLEMICDASPIEVGNMVWNDANKNGKQDANEVGIDGVVVKLFQSGVEIASTTTAGGGNYGFSSSTTGSSSGWAYNVSQLLPFTSYELRILSYTAQPPLSAALMSPANNGGSDIYAYFRDSDGTPSSGNVVKAFTTGASGVNNHSYDFGFYNYDCTPTVTTSVSNCYDSNGNTAGGSSIATVQVIVDWVDVVANELITVNVTGAGAQIINPATATVKPTVLNFTVPADGASLTVSATYITCSTSKNVNAPAGNCLLAACQTGNTGGTVWRDYNNNGVKDAVETTGLSGVTVKAYDCNGNLAATTTTDYLGQYTFGTLSPVPSSTNKYRIEFSNLSYPYKPTFNGTNGRTDVQFITAASCSVSLGVNNPADYCQANPKLATPCYINGDIGTDSPADAMVTWNYTASGTGSATKKTVSNKVNIGSTWGMAYSTKTNRIYAATFVKRHSGIGIGGLGAIYSINPDSSTTNGSVLMSIPNVGTLSSNATRGLVGVGVSNTDVEAFGKVGEVGLGDIDISDDQTKLYTVNLFTKKIIVVDIATKTVLDSIAIPDPGCLGGVSRPFGLKVYKGKLYVGTVCDASSTAPLNAKTSNLEAFVYEMNLTTSTFNTNPILNFGLNYLRSSAWNEPVYGGTTGMPVSSRAWYPWKDVFNATNFQAYTSAGYYRLCHPTPILSDIEIDADGAMILGLSDRTSHQISNNNYAPDFPTSGLQELAVSGGDILKANYNNGVWNMEPLTYGATATSATAPFESEFFKGEVYAVHAESAQGGLALIVSKGEVVTSALDPLAYFTGGIIKLSTSTGNKIASSAYQIFVGGSAKSTGIGDLITLCQAQPIQIGNYVWRDSNKDGVQDACESPLSNITVSLWKSGTQIATTTTNATGEYYFSDKNVAGITWTGAGADTTIRSNTAYEIRINNKNQTILDTMRLTIANVTTNNGNDLNDSDASIVGNYSVISLTTGEAGSTNHSYDFGFYPCFVPSLLDTSLIACGAQNINLTTLVRDISAKTKDSVAQTYFRYYNSNWTNVTNSTAVPISTNDSFYIVKDVFNCYNGDTMKVVVTIQPVPTPPSVSSPQTNTCPTETVDLTALSSVLTPSISGSTFEWRVSSSSSSALVGTPTAVSNGTYYVFEKSPAGCFSPGTAVQVQTQVCCPTPECIPIFITRSTASN